MPGPGKVEKASLMDAQRRLKEFIKKTQASFPPKVEHGPPENGTKKTRRFRTWEASFLGSMLNLRGGSVLDWNWSMGRLMLNATDDGWNLGWCPMRDV